MKVQGEVRGQCFFCASFKAWCEVCPRVRCTPRSAFRRGISGGRIAWPPTSLPPQLVASGILRDGPMPGNYATSLGTRRLLKAACPFGIWNMIVILLNSGEEHLEARFGRPGPDGCARCKQYNTAARCQCVANLCGRVARQLL